MKILIITSNPISKTENNGKTLRSFFSQFPIDDLATLYFHQNLVPDTTTCNNLFRITDIDVLKSIITFRFKTGNSITDSRNFNSSDTVTLSSSSEKKFFTSCKTYLKKIPFFRELIWSLNTWDSVALNNWISDFKPDVIFAMLGDSIFAHNIAVKLSIRYNIPLCIYITDDYIINDYSSNVIESHHHKKLIKIYRKTIERASICFAIGDKMATAYSKIFKKHFDTLINSADYDRNNLPNKVTVDPSKEIIISYIGGLHYHRWETICKLGDAVKSVPNLKIQVFTNSNPSDEILRAFSNSKISFCGSLDEQGVQQQMLKSHYLLHVESFRMEDVLFTQYSVSTKIPEYLYSNRIPICFGPSNIASVEIFKNNSLGIVIDERDSNQSILEKITESIKTYSAFNFDNNIQYAEVHFSREAMCKKIKSQLLSVIEIKQDRV